MFLAASGRRIGGGERLPADLHRAAGDDDAGVRARPPRPPDGVTGFRVRLRRDRARVHEDEICPLVAVDDGDPALAQESGGTLHLGLVDLAAEVRDRGRANRHGDSSALHSCAHHSFGFVLIRNPIVPTSAAIV